MYGAWRAAVQNNLFNIENFDLSEYLYSERTVNNDWSWITPNVIAFASPDDPRFRKGIQQGLIRPKGAEEGDPGVSQDYVELTPDTDDEQKTFTMWDEMRGRLLSDFHARDVRLVVRLNDALYDRAIFTNAGIDHLDLYFEDGSNPTDQILRTFLHRVRAAVRHGGAVAVHCKAGLGRTGVLIGSYLIYKYGFDANEAIAWMRLMRPGCVVGPQQHYLRNKTRTLVCWAERDRSKEAELCLRKERKRLLDEIKMLTTNMDHAHAQLTAQDRDPSKPKSLRLLRAPFSPRSKPTVMDAENEPPGAEEDSSLLTRPSAPFVAEAGAASTPTAHSMRTPKAPTKGARAHNLFGPHGLFAPVIPPENLITPVVGQPRKSNRLTGDGPLFSETGSASGSTSRFAIAAGPLPPALTPEPSPKATMPTHAGRNEERDTHGFSTRDWLPHRADELWTTHARTRVKTAEKEQVLTTPDQRLTTLTPPTYPPSPTPPVLTGTQSL